MLSFAAMTEQLQTDVLPATPESIAEAARRLRAGELVAFPTETVYGLGAEATQDRAVARIFKAKARPHFNPLIVHLPDRRSAEQEVAFEAGAARLAEAFWPGPLTLVLPRRMSSEVSLLCSAGLDTLAVRVPSSQVAHALLSAVGRPVAAPSANSSGEVSPTTANHVLASLGGKVPLILDDGPCPVGLESTVVEVRGGTARLLRPGGITREALEAVAGPIAEADPQAPIAAPGLLQSHYAPRLPLRLDARSAASDEAFLAFGPAPGTEAAVSLNLSESGDLVEAAAGLFAALRALDRPGLRAIAVMPVPECGLGEAINDRLRRAAAPRG
jgi:L-threonylcarbamoyladenylate synthase